ncbi:MAG: hypothetical protein AAFY41_12780, partial [Bacteroidota bacterium]
MGGAAFFTIVAATLTLTNTAPTSKVEALNYLVPTYFFSALAIHPFLFKNAIKSALNKEMPLTKKIATFQTGHIIRMAVLEGSAFLASVAVILNGELLYLVITALVLVIMFQKIPSPFLLETE